ncbi:hypothetical protein EV182_003811 [Spiromyces aspiralis]|uniref:Uncharacterized protein n=1 Tax=Spiromyces aspiralis TaxID=68401 RepID=A0ACC1HW15_9FUNG|nr:hypothetical protein EV182_003811 [Spiromyces aspiralis]
MPFKGESVIHELISTVARSFYDDQTVLVLEFLKYKSRHVGRQYISSDRIEVAAELIKTGFPFIDATGSMYERIHSGSEKRHDPRKHDQVPMQRTYYHLDFKLFVDVVKWRVWRLQKTVQQRVKEKPSNKDYICPSCDASYSIMEALSLMDASGLFKCERCGSELRDNKFASHDMSSESLLVVMSQQCKRIIDLLQQTDNIILPPPLPLSQIPPPDYDGDDFANFNIKNTKSGGEKEISIARDNGERTGEIVVDFEPDLSSKEASRRREQEIELKRKQNALPPWHIWSTVSHAQMVPDEKVLPTLRREHEKRYPSLTKSYTTESVGAQATRPIASVMWSKSHSMPQYITGTLDASKHDDSDEEQRAQFFSDYYTIYAQKTGIPLRLNEKDHFYSVLKKFERDERVEHDAWEIEKQYLKETQPDSSMNLKRDPSYVPKNLRAAKMLKSVWANRKRLFDFLEDDECASPRPLQQQLSPPSQQQTHHQFGSPDMQARYKNTSADDNNSDNTGSDSTNSTHVMVPPPHLQSQKA